MNFSNSLTKWYLQNKRDLPWRKTQNPYFVWLSEIMLQQTRVAQGMPYYFEFIDAFPTVFDLAEASEEQVLKLWQGLGYYSRARNLHKTAQYIAFELNGVFPDNYHDLLKLKGVGEYTAAAIASFCYDELVPVVDGNVFRVLSRYFDVETDIALTSAKKDFAALALELMPKNIRVGAQLSEANPALFNQAIMEFGALQCVPKSPNCENCVLNQGCLALQKKKVAVLPVKSKKLKIKNRYLNYIVFLDQENQTIIQKRTAKGIWLHLFEFPLIETETEGDFEMISSTILERNFVENKIISITPSSNTTLHKLTHQHLYINFWQVTVEDTISGGIDFQSISEFPFPIVIFNFIQRESNSFKNLYI